LILDEIYFRFILCLKPNRLLILCPDKNETAQEQNTYREKKIGKKGVKPHISRENNSEIPAGKTSPVSTCLR